MKPAPKTVRVDRATFAALREVVAEVAERERHVTIEGTRTWVCGYCSEPEDRDARVAHADGCLYLRAGAALRLLRGGA